MVARSETGSRALGLPKRLGAQGELAKERERGRQSENEPATPKPSS